jgi:hypothetical protein
MGAVSLQEDSVERYVESNPGTKWSSSTGDGAMATAKPVLKYCPLCIQGFLEESSLDRHVATEHGKQHIYLKVNDRIVREICWVTRSMDKCDLVVLGLPAVDVEMECGAETTRFEIRPSAPSLMRHIPAGLKEEIIRIKATSPHQSLRFEIYLGRQPTFRPEHIDTALVELMMAMKVNPKTDLAAFREEWSKKHLNELERRYVEGVLEYCHGWRLEEDKNKVFARDRLEAAMNLLIPFRTLLSDDIRCALALRMNTFGGEWGCDEASPFRLAEAFFCCDAAEARQNEMRQTVIPMASFLERTLKAVRAHYAKDGPGVFAILDELQPRNRNDEDKVAILKARMRRNLLDRQGAAAAYETLLDHPVYGDEAKRSIRR